MCDIDGLNAAIMELTGELWYQGSDDEYNREFARNHVRGYAEEADFLRDVEAKWRWMAESGETEEQTRRVQQGKAVVRVIFGVMGERPLSVKWKHVRPSTSPRAPGPLL